MKKNDHMPAASCSRISLGMVMIIVLSMLCSMSLYNLGQAEAAVAALNDWPATPQIANQTTSPQTTSFTPTAGSNRLIMIYIVNIPGNTTATTMTVTYGSNNIAATEIVNSAANQRRQAWLFYLTEADIAAATGSTISVNNNNAAGGFSVYIATYSGVDQTTPITDFGGQYINNTSGTLNYLAPLNINIGGYGIIGAGCNTTGGTIGESYIDHGEVTLGGGFSRLGSLAFASAGTTNPGVTYGANVRGGAAGCTLNPSAAGSTPGITVNPTSGLTTTEAGGQATFTIVLDSAPTNNVSIGVSSSDTSEGTVSPGSLTFTTGNWNTAQTVTVTGVDDAIVDGNIAYTIVTAAASSADSNYSGMNAADVSVTNMDDDVAGAPGITVNPTSGLTTTEAGGTAQFTIVLDSAPTNNVSIGVSSSDTSEGTVSPGSLTFTTGNWNTAQTVTVTGVDDAIVDGNIAYTIITAAATSTDGNYNGLNASDVAVTNMDNDVAGAPGITLNPTSGLTTTEAGGTAQFTIVLDSVPTANVSIGLSSSITSEGAVAPSSVTFTTGNWSTPQTVTVTGADDAVVDGNVAYTIITAAATSTDGNYNGLNASDVAVTNMDNDGAPAEVPAGSWPLFVAVAAGMITYAVLWRKKQGKTAR